MMQKKMRFQINEMGEVETVFWFSDPFSVTGGALLSHPSDTGDNELTALWTEAGGINKSKFISPAPKASQSSSGLSAVVPGEPKTLIYGAVWQRWMWSEEEKGATWCQNRANHSTLTSEKRTPVLLRCSSSCNRQVK